METDLIDRALASANLRQDQQQALQPLGDQINRVESQVARRVLFPDEESAEKPKRRRGRRLLPLAPLVSRPRQI